MSSTNSSLSSLSSRLNPPLILRPSSRQQASSSVLPFSSTSTSCPKPDDQTGAKIVYTGSGKKKFGQSLVRLSEKLSSSTGWLQKKVAHHADFFSQPRSSRKIERFIEQPDCLENLNSHFSSENDESFHDENWGKAILSDRNCTTASTFDPHASLEYFGDITSKINNSVSPGHRFNRPAVNNTTKANTTTTMPEAIFSVDSIHDHDAATSETSTAPDSGIAPATGSSALQSTYLPLLARFRDLSDASLMELANCLDPHAALKTSKSPGRLSGVDCIKAMQTFIQVCLCPQSGMDESDAEAAGIAESSINTAVIEFCAMWTTTSKTNPDLLFKFDFSKEMDKIVACIGFVAMDDATEEALCKFMWAIKGIDSTRIAKGQKNAVSPPLHREKISPHFLPVDDINGKASIENFKQFIRIFTGPAQGNLGACSVRVKVFALDFSDQLERLVIRFPEFLDQYSFVRTVHDMAKTLLDEKLVEVHVPSPIAPSGSSESDASGSKREDSSHYSGNGSWGDW